MNKMLPLICLAILTSSCAYRGGIRNSAIQDVAVSDLVSNPEFYNNAIVRIKGASVMRFEANFLCASVEDIGSGNSKKCLWLSPVPAKGTLGPLDSGLYHNKIVVVVGVFDKDFRGHMSAYGGAIAPISVQIVGSHARGDIPPPPPEPGSAAKP